MTEVVEEKAIEVPSVKGTDEQLAEYKERYKVLTTYVSAVNARIEPLKVEMRGFADESERFRVLAMEKAKQISEQRGGQAWFAIKKEIGMLAKLLGGL